MYKNPRDYRTFFIYLFYGIIVFSVLCQPPKLINKNDDLTGLKTAGYWEETPIFIDGDATGVDAHNWTWVESQVWFGGGDGTWKNPYIIENITIDGSDSANCLEIRDSSVFFIVRNCTLYSSSSGEYDAGIKLENINNGTLTENNCSNNGASGIVIINGLNNTISSNNVTFNGKNGIFLHLSNNNTIEDNNIINNTEYGSFLNFSESNDLYLNNFSSNGIHAIDNGSFNEWDNGVIGNYWDNYTELGAGAVDANDDGIGDIPYDISGSAGAKDYYPIWDDGDDIAPSIIINDPTDLTSWNTAPPINVTVYDPNFDSLWYKVGADTEPLTNNTEDFLLTSIWDGLGEGPFQLEIFANDTAGNLNDTYVLTLYKDTLSPSIVINSPANLTYWFTAPSISVTIYDDNFDSLWYKVDGTTEPLANNTAEFLLTSIWDGLGEGPFQLEIFANDTFGHINNTYVLTLYKDTINPSIVINSPMNQTYWNSPPVINITVYDMYLDSLWYRVDGTTEPLTNNTAEFLLTSIWDGLGEGPFQLEIFANDSAGNINNTYVLTLYKDTLNPSIVINSPANLTYWFTAPSISVTIYDDNFDSLWYRVDGTTEPLANNTAEFLLTSIWDGLGEGPFQLEIFANDTLGNLNDTFVLTLYKDTTYPSIVINSPMNQTYWNTPPVINITVYDMYLDSLWYRVDGTTEPLTNNTAEFLLTSIWDGLGEGPFQLEIFANDSAGNLNDTYVLTLYKDTLNPSIVINSPANLTYWFVAPSINVTIYDDNFDSLWYRVDGTTEPLTNNTAEFLLTSIWDGLGEGPFQLEIFANDTLGNLNDTYVLTLYKDTVYPILTINSPLNNSIWATPPLINVTVYDMYLDSLWYWVDGTTEPLTNNTAELLLASIWATLPEGPFQIYFFANDLAGNLNNTYVYTLTKQAPLYQTFINSPANETYWNTRPSINVTVYGPDLDTIWYQVDATIKILTNDTAEFLLTSIWDGLKEGPFDLHIWLNDTFGVLQDHIILTLYKDTVNPSIIINVPMNQTYWNSPPPINVAVYDVNFDSLWYRVNADTEPLTNNTEEFLLTSIWNGLGQGWFVIEFYANDTVGNINNTITLLLNKDTINPSIVVNTPTDLTLWETRPPINITVYDTNFDSLWYRVNGINEPLTNNTEELLLNTIWNSLSDGTFQIEIFANDTAGNLNNIFTLTLDKDVLNPMIFINLPLNQSYWNSPPLINIIVYEAHLDTIWYTVNTVGPIETLNNNTDELLLSSIWNGLGQGWFTIEFYANDTTGKLNDTYILALYKDTTVPEIIINLPLDLSYWVTPPPINITVYDDNFESLWYRVNGITELLTNNTAEFLLTSIWNSLGDGVFLIEIMANDSAGNINNTYILTLYKDVLPPDITINSPLIGEQFTQSSPTFDLTIIEVTPDTYWYSLYNGTHWSKNITFTGSTGTIDQTLWDLMPEGGIIIQFYANDSYGRIGSATVTVYKRIPKGFDLLAFLTSIPGIITMSTIVAVIVIAIVIIKKKRGAYKSKKKEIMRIHEIRRKRSEDLK